jgi:WD40 repeat protein
MAGCDKTAKCWDLATNQSIQVAAHDGPIKTCHWIKASTYSCLMTGSWDKTLRVNIKYLSNIIITLDSMHKFHYFFVIISYLITRKFFCISFNLFIKRFYQSIYQYIFSFGICVAPNLP